MTFFIFAKKNGLLWLMGMAVVGVVAFSVFLSFVKEPIDRNGTAITVEIPHGAGFSQVMNILDEQGLLKSRTLFYLLARLMDAPTHIRTGDYEFNSSLSPEEIIRKLIRGEIKRYLVTIPEGFTVKQIAFRLASINLVDEKEFLALASDPDFLQSLRIPAKCAEGYLFPETYFFDRSMEARGIIQLMVGRFRHAITSGMEKRAAESGMTLHQFLTLASIIEKETGLRTEMPLVSAVFHNRLKNGMRLQSCPTVIYGLDHFDGRLTKEHLLMKTPYNTYVIDGLPPGPIANPSLDAIKAALHPAKTNYLYFVSKNDSSHQFSVDLPHHNQAVRTYQVRKDNHKRQ
jgi:UPF0755 protein